MANACVFVFLTIAVCLVLSLSAGESGRSNLEITFQNYVEPDGDGNISAEKYAEFLKDILLYRGSGAENEEARKHFDRELISIMEEGISELIQEKRGKRITLAEAMKDIATGEVLKRVKDKIARKMSKKPAKNDL